MLNKYNFALREFCNYCVYKATNFCVVQLMSEVGIYGPKNVAHPCHKHLTKIKTCLVLSETGK